MIIIGVDFHPEFQQIAWVDTESGEFQEQRLAHREDAEKFYRGLAAAGQKVRVGMEASGHARWFERLVAELQFELWIAAFKRSLLRLLHSFPCSLPQRFSRKELSEGASNSRVWARTGGCPQIKRLFSTVWRGGKQTFCKACRTPLGSAAPDFRTEHFPGP